MASTAIATASINAELASMRRAAADAFPHIPWPDLQQVDNQLPKGECHCEPAKGCVHMAEPNESCDGELPGNGEAQVANTRHCAGHSNEQQGWGGRIRNGPVASKSVPARVMPFIEVRRSDNRPSERAIATGKRAKEAEVTES